MCYHHSPGNLIFLVGRHGEGRGRCGFCDDGILMPLIGKGGGRRKRKTQLWREGRGGGCGGEGSGERASGVCSYGTRPSSF